MVQRGMLGRLFPGGRVWVRWAAADDSLADRRDAESFHVTMLINGLTTTLDAPVQCVVGSPLRAALALGVALAAWSLIHPARPDAARLLAPAGHVFGDLGVICSRAARAPLRCVVTRANRSRIHFLDRWQPMEQWRTWACEAASAGTGTGTGTGTSARHGQPNSRKPAASRSARVLVRQWIEQR